MKSDEEFIAGIYRKAQERKIEEENGARCLPGTGRRRRFYGLGTLAAAVCLCMIVSGVVYAGNWKKMGNNPAEISQGETSGESAVAVLSIGGPKTEDRDTPEGSEAAPRGRIEPESRNVGEPAGEDGERQKTRSVRPGENAVVQGLQTGFLFANPASDQEDNTVPSGRDGADIPGGEDGEDRINIPGTGGK